jgi:hypothetical protein
MDTKVIEDMNIEAEDTETMNTEVRIIEIRVTGIMDIVMETETRENGITIHLMNRIAGLLYA